MALRVGELYGVLKLDKSSFDKGISEGGMSFRTFAKGIAAASALAVAAIVGIGASAVKLATDFEAGMANVQTLLGKGSKAEARIEEFKSAVKDLSVETGASMAGMTDGIYQVISAWGDTEDTVGLLEISTKAAKAGLANTADAVNLLSTVTKGYGDVSKESAQKVADMAFQTANLGQTTFPELAASMGKVIPLAATMKVSQEELFGAMATLTGVTGNTAEVTTQLKAVLSALINANPEMIKGLKRQGFESGTAAVKTLGLAGTLDMLKKASGGSDQALAKMLGSSEALTAVLALTGNQAADFASKTEAMAEASGAATNAFDIQQQTAAAAADRVSAAFQVILVNLGEKLLPLMAAALEWVSANMPAIQVIFDQVFDAVGAAIEWVATSVLPTLVARLEWLATNVLPAFAAGAATVGTDVVPTLAEAFRFIAEEVVPVLAAAFEWISTNIVPSLVSVFTTLSTTIVPALAQAFASVQAWISENWPLISKVVGQVAGAVKTAFEVIAAVIAAVAPVIVRVGEVVFPVLGAAASALLEVMTLVFDAIGAVWQGAADVADTVVEAIFGSWEGMGDFFNETMGNVGRAVKDGINVVIGLVNQFISFMNSIKIDIPGLDTPVGKVAAFKWDGLNLPTIPMLASGTPNFRGGWAMLGEEGPELARLPGGTRVFSAGETAGMGGTNIGTVNLNVSGAREPEVFAREALQALRRELDRQGMSLA